MKYKISVFWVMGLNIISRVGTHILGWGHKILCILKGISPFKMHNNSFFPENLKKNLGLTTGA